MRRQDKHVNFCCVRAPIDHSLIDCRNPANKTQLFVAVRAEECELASVLFEAGANKNVTVSDPECLAQGVRAASFGGRRGRFWEVFGGASSGLNECVEGTALFAT